MTPRHAINWIENNVYQIIGGLIIAMLVGNVTLYAINTGLRTEIQDNGKRIDAVENQLIGKNAWIMMRDDIKEIKLTLNHFAEKNETDHDSIKAKLGRMNAKLKK